MDLGFKVKSEGRNLMIFFDKEVPGWKRYASELINDNVIMDSKDVEMMIREKGDLIVYEVYNLWKSVKKMNQIHDKTDMNCDMTFLNSGVFSPDDDGELFVTYGHVHEKKFGEAYYVLKNDCYFNLYDPEAKECYILKVKQGKTILIHPRFMHRMVAADRDCLVLAFVPSKTGHDYNVVKNKGFPVHVFRNGKKIRLVKNPKYGKVKIKLVSKLKSQINALRLYESNPDKLDQILEKPEQSKKIYSL